jgi:hypothetical protein
VREIGIFGSFVRGEQKRRSDVDILVEYDGIPDQFEFINLERYFQCLLRKSPEQAGTGSARLPIGRQACRPAGRSGILLKTKKDSRLGRVAEDDRTSRNDILVGLS